MDEITKGYYEAMKKVAAKFNDTQAEEEMIVGQVLDGDDAVGFLQWLMDTGKRVRGG